MLPDVQIPPTNDAVAPFYCRSLQLMPTTDAPLQIPPTMEPTRQSGNIR